jgi:hypothetical protein
MGIAFVFRHRKMMDGEGWKAEREKKINREDNQADGQVYNVLSNQ